MSGEDYGSIILYQTEDGKSRIEVTLCNDTVWLKLLHFLQQFKMKEIEKSNEIWNTITLT